MENRMDLRAPGPGSSERKGTRRTPALLHTALAVAVGAALGFAAGNRNSTQAVTTPEGAPALPAAQPSAPLSVARSSSAAQRRSLAARSPVNEEEREAEATYRREQSKEVFDGMLEHFKMAVRAMPGNPEAVATAMRMYQTGAAETLVRAAPELIPDLAKQIEGSLCEAGASDAQLMVMAQLAGDVPELASESGFDCVFQKRKGEDLALWRTLDAWRRSGMARTPGIEQLERSATHEQTRLRLKDEDPVAELTARAASREGSPASEAPRPLKDLIK
jgi:hypothetical protein